MTPMYSTMDSRKNLQTMFTIKNPTDKPVAVDFSVLQLIDTDNNKEQRIKSSKVAFYPSQFVLDSNSTKNVRVRYMKKTLPEQEEVYRVIAQELNVDVEDRDVENTKDEGIQAKIKMRYSYEALLFVKNRKVTAQLKIASFNVPSANDITITIENMGGASTIFNTTEYNLIVSINNKDYILKNDDLKNAEFRRILAQKSNTYHLQYVKSLPSGTISSIRIEKK